MLEYGVSIFPKSFSEWRLHKRQFPKRQLPNVKIPKRQLPKGCERPSEAQQTLFGGRAERCGLDWPGGRTCYLEDRTMRLGPNSDVVLGKSHSWGSCRLGNHMVRKLPLGKSHSWEVAAWEISQLRSCRLGNRWEVAAWEITQLRSYRLGNHTVGKLPLGKSHS